MRRYLVMLVCLTSLPVADSGAFGADAAGASALIGSIDRQAEHARGWLEAGDFKSLSQSAGSLDLLAAVLAAQSDDGPWQAAAGRVLEQARSLRAAAQGENAASAKAALESLTAANLAASKLQPTGQPLPPPKSNLRALMLLLDGLRGEAKIALIVGNPEKAKNQARVLSQLGPLVSNLQSCERWSKLSQDFTDASLAAARSTATDAAELRPLLKAVSQRCDACHDTR